MFVRGGTRSENQTCAKPSSMHAPLDNLNPDTACRFSVDTAYDRNGFKVFSAFESLYAYRLAMSRLLIKIVNSNCTFIDYPAFWQSTYGVPRCQTAH